MRLILFALCICHQKAEETEAPQPGMVMAQRLMSTIPRIPNVIQGQMEGKPQELKSVCIPIKASKNLYIIYLSRNMISHMLGDGLISQLVVNPLGVSKVAEGMGVSLKELGINKTDVETKLDEITGAKRLFDGSNQTSSGDPSLSLGLFKAFTTPTTTTTEKIMYLDGVPIKDFDTFVRSHNLEHRFPTKNPVTVTTPIPSANDIAAAVFERIKSSLPSSTDVEHTTSPIPRNIPVEDFSNTLNLAMIDPRRINEVNSLLRRSPQKFDTLEPANTFSVGPPGSFIQSPDSIIQPLDPAIDEVVTSLRTQGEMNVERVKQLQNILQTYEQTLQTKELLSKRKQLQVLQNELAEQRKRIDLQRKMEDELKRKEKRKTMEAQLREQLNNWHSSFNNNPRSAISLSPLDLPEINPVEYPILVTQPSIEMPSPSSYPFPDMVARPSSIERSDTSMMQDSEESSTATNRALRVYTTAPSNSELSNIRYSPQKATSTNLEYEDDDDFTSSCECTEISMEKIKGQWVMALASPNLTLKISQEIGRLLHSEQPVTLNCSRVIGIYIGFFPRVKSVIITITFKKISHMNHTIKNF
uniref:Fibrinogen C-terminal domain-containing protein n=1 Tax=Heterorhabditis bacteriophora TaxID=37862 RepID=A0A1I7X876_HETBA